MPGHALVVRHCTAELLEFQNENVWRCLHGISPCQEPLLGESVWIHALREMVTAAPDLAPFCIEKVIVETLRRSPATFPDAAIVLAHAVPHLQTADAGIELIQAIAMVVVHPSQGNQRISAYHDIDRWVRDAHDGFLRLAEAVVGRVGDRKAVATVMARARVDRGLCSAFARGEAVSLLWFERIAARILFYDCEVEERDWWYNRDE
jgi:hypothetical protein